jgi:hypothetical protein
MNEPTRKQLQIAVERAVRPVRVGWWRRDHMREELLAHLTGVFEDEMGRVGDEAAASREALRRFGEPAKLTEELNAARNVEDRVAYALELVYGWRAPESAARYMFRVSVSVFLTLAATIGVALAAGDVVAGATRGRTYPSVWFIPGMVCAALFPLGLLYFKMRDAMFGFCSPKSRLRVTAFGALFGLVTFAVGLACALMGTWNWREAWDLVTPYWLIVSALAPLAPLAAAWRRGLAEIRHTEWSALQLD